MTKNEAGTIAPLLTIGIVVYNKEPYLKILLDQIIHQMDKYRLYKEIEVVVSDNASTDSTEQLMEKYMRKRLPYLRYNRNKRNLGISGNVLKQIELAKGKYLWCIGDDELLEGGLKRILQIIKKYEDKHDAGNYIFLTSIANIYDKKIWVSSIAKDADFILPNCANMTTTVIPVNPTRKTVKEFIGKGKVDKIWPNTHINLLTAIKFDCQWVLIHNNIFRYMTRFPDKSKPYALCHAQNIQSYFDTIINLDKATKENLFSRIKKASHLLVIIPFLDTFNPETNMKVRREVKKIRDKYDLRLLGTLGYLMLLIPGFIRRIFFDLGYIFYGKSYANYRRTLAENRHKTLN